MNESLASVIGTTGDDQFEQDVIQAKLPVLVDFWADWCNPCKAIAPTLDEIAQKYQGRVQFYKVNVDQNEKTTTRFNVRSIPTLILFQDGDVVTTHIGGLTKSQFITLLDEHLKDSP